MKATKRFVSELRAAIDMYFCESDKDDLWLVDLLKSQGVKPREIKKVAAAIDRLSDEQKGIACLNLTEFVTVARRIDLLYNHLEAELFVALGPTPKGVARWFVRL